MTKIIFIALMLFALQAQCLSGLDFVYGYNKDFNKELAERFTRSAIKAFSGGLVPSREFEEELEFFLREEGSHIYLNGEPSKVKRTKFYLTFFIQGKALKKTHYTFFSYKKPLSTWDLAGFKKTSINYPRGHKYLPENCLKINVKDSDVVDFYRFTLADESCSAVITRVTLEHPAYKGFVESLEESGSRSLIVKHLLPGMTAVPTEVLIFGKNWRLPPSRFLNDGESVQLYLP